MSEPRQAPKPHYGDYRDRLLRHSRWPGWPIETTDKTAGAEVISTPGVARRP
jgi:hypothetical protein